MDKKIRVVVIGCGDRSTTYCEEGVLKANRMEIVAAIDPNIERLRYMQEHFGVPADKCYTDIESVLKQGKIGDCVINGTMDQYHFDTAVPFLEQGYDMLLEKPVVNNEEDLLAIRDIAERNNCKLTVCHVLRYAPFYKTIKEIILSGDLGEIMNIQTSERVGAFHSSAAYLRGKWNREDVCGSSFLLAKCCHDIDLLCWLNNTTEPLSVVSMGGRNYFVEEKAPANAGTRCLNDCPDELKEKCIYNAENMYLEHCLLPQYPWQCTGKNYQDVTEEEKIASLKGENPHGKCIYKAGGDLVDHQNVMVHFKNGSTALHTMTMGAMRPGRSIWIQGTEGELEGWAEDGKIFRRKYDKNTSMFVENCIIPAALEGEVSGHFGGDHGLVMDFCDRLEGKEPSISCTSIDDSIWGHRVCYAADKSMRENTIYTLETL